jgi:hypothetical protein
MQITVARSLNYRPNNSKQAPTNHFVPEKIVGQKWLNLNNYRKEAEKFFIVAITQEKILILCSFCTF